MPCFTAELSKRSIPHLKLADILNISVTFIPKEIVLSRELIDCGGVDREYLATLPFNRSFTEYSVISVPISRILHSTSLLSSARTSLLPA